MKIEKINDNQIKCTLTKEDLEQHQIRLSELAYGTEKARQLFRNMMEEAQSKFGFQADNIPLVIEAIPMRGDSIILIITKVEDPEELDTRFSKFAPDHGAAGENLLQFDGADSIIDIFQKIYEAKTKAAAKKAAPSGEDDAPKEEAETPVNLIHLYQFGDLDTVISAAHGLNGFYSGVNSLYKDSRQGTYLLVVHQTSYTPEEFNKVCNILSEYGRGRSFSHSGEAHLLEHCEHIVLETALQQLNRL